MIVQYGCSDGRSVHSSCSGMFLLLTGMSCSSDDMSNGTVKALPELVDEVLVVVAEGEGDDDIVVCWAW